MKKIISIIILYLMLLNCQCFIIPLIKVIVRTIIKKKPFNPNAVPIIENIAQSLPKQSYLSKLAEKIKN